MCTRSELNTILSELAKSYRATYGNRLSRIVLYGSYARGDYRDDSDIDVAAIVKGPRRELQDELKKVWDVSHDLGLEYGIIVSPTVIPYDEYEKMKDDLPYYKNIELEGVTVSGWAKQKSLSDYRLESAEEHLKSSKLLLDAGVLKDSIGRSYYAMFAAARALLALEGKDFSKHAGVISYFQKEYIKTRRLDVKYSKYLVEAFQIINNADYSDYYIVAKSDAVEQYEKAKEFYNEIRRFIDEMDW